MLLKKTRLVKSPKSRKNLFWTFLKLEFFGTFRVVKDDPKKKQKRFLLQSACQGAFLICPGLDNTSVRR